MWLAKNKIAPNFFQAPLLMLCRVYLLQLDEPPEMDTLKINLPRDREDYDGFEYTDEKLSTKRIQWCRDPSSILFFWVFLNNNFANNDNGAWVNAQLGAPRRKV